MNSSAHLTRMSALAYLYDNLRDLPAWIHRLTKGQLEDIADLVTAWQAADDRNILPMEEIEKREVLRALILCKGNVPTTAEKLGIGKTTLYIKLRKWGDSIENRVLVEQASALMQRRGIEREPFYDGV